MHYQSENRQARDSYRSEPVIRKGWMACGFLPVCLLPLGVLVIGLLFKARRKKKNTSKGSPSFLAQVINLQRQTPTHTCHRPGLHSWATRVGTGASQ